MGDEQQCREQEKRPKHFTGKMLQGTSQKPSNQIHPCLAAGGLTYKLPSCQQNRPRVSELEDLQGVALGRAQATHSGLGGLGGQYQLLLQVPWVGVELLRLPNLLYM